MICCFYGYTRLFLKVRTEKRVGKKKKSAVVFLDVVLFGARELSGCFRLFVQSECRFHVQKKKSLISRFVFKSAAFFITLDYCQFGSITCLLSQVCIFFHGQHY